MSSFDSFGSDPEFMLVDKKGKLKSAIGIIPGNSDDPVVVGEYGFYYDNVLAECRIKPGFSRNEAIHNFRECFLEFSKIVHPFRLVPRASADYPRAELEHPIAKIVGCNEEFCGYTMKPIPKPEAEFQSGRLRTAGGHVHVGGTGLVQDIWSVQYFIKMLDLFLAVPSLYIDKDPTSAARRKIYGDLGSHRAKEYGFEYRVLGNFWLSSPKLVGLIYDICEWTTNFVNDGGHLQFWSKDENIFGERIRGDRNVETAFTCSKYSKNRLQEAIKNSDLTIGSEFMSLIKEYMPMSLVKDIMAASNDKQHDFYEEWAL